MVSATATVASAAKSSAVESVLQKMSAYRSSCPFLSQTPVQRLKELASTRRQQPCIAADGLSADIDTNNNKNNNNNSISSNKCPFVQPPVTQETSNVPVNALTAAAYKCPVMSQALSAVDKQPKSTGKLNACIGACIYFHYKH